MTNTGYWYSELRRRPYPVPVVCPRRSSSRLGPYWRGVRVCVSYS